MGPKRIWFKRMVWGGVCAVAAVLLLTALLNVLLNSISILGSAPAGHIQLTFDRCAAYFGSAAVAVAVEWLSVFALGAAIGLSTMPYAESKQMVAASLTHFLMTGVLSMLVGWAYRWFGFSPDEGPWRVLIAYLVIYILIWAVRWIIWYVELCKLRRALGLVGEREEMP